MNSIIDIILSKIKFLWIQVLRSADHLFRSFSGLPARRRSMITPELFVGGQYSDIGLEKLHRREVSAIVNMRMNSYEKTAKAKGMRYLHLPTIDQQAPSLTDLQAGAKFIAEEIERGGKVYVHCRGGEGRGPSMAIAYLISTGLTYEDAYETVKQTRSFIRPTAVQIARLREFETLQKK